MPVRPVVAVALAMAVPFALVGCSEAEGPDPAPHADATADDAEVEVVEENQADLVLYASNQSFDDEKVRQEQTLRVGALDIQPFISRNFYS